MGKLSWDESKRAKFLHHIKDCSPNYAARLAGFVWQDMRLYLLEDKQIRDAIGDYGVRQQIKRRRVER